MKKANATALVVLIFFTSFMSFTAIASSPCEILTEGNKLYKKDNAGAINIYKRVKHIDKLGTDRCTASIYATIGTIYKILGDASSGSQKAIIYYRLSSKYNRAFATALMCHGGDCGASLDFWDEKSFWSN